MTGRSISFAVFFLLLTAPSLAQVPPQVQADLLNRQIVEALREHPPSERQILSLIEQYHALEASSHVRVPPGVLYNEARLTAAQDPVRAKKALELYFSRASKRADESYERALGIYPDVQRRATAAEEQARQEAAAEIAAYQRAAEEQRKQKAEAALKKQREEVAGKVADVIRGAQEAMVSIPAGSFKMGVAPGKGGDQDGFSAPVHTVRLKAFKISKHEVKKEWWQVYLAHTGAAFEPRSDVSWDDPVTGVSWQQVQAFITWLNQVSGQTYRLPSEAEWEYAARAGTTSPYPWGKRFEYAVGMERADWDGTLFGYGRGGVKSVSLFPSNSNKWGLYDVIGNASEWVADCWHDSYVDAPTDGSVWTSPNCQSHVLRGGSASNVFVTAHADVLNLISGKHDVHISIWTRVEGSGSPEEAGFRLASD